MNVVNRSGFLKGKDAQIIDLYLKGSGCEIISRKYGCCSEAIRILLKRNNIILRGKSTYRKHKINHEYFSTITTENQAWLLGFIMADGSVSRGSGGYYLRIDLADRDIDILKKIIKLLDCDYAISANLKRKSCCIILSSKRIFDDLCMYGVVPNKTYMEGTDLRSVLNPCLWRHFLRGMFDGDGWFTVDNKGSPIWGIIGTKNVVGVMVNEMCDFLNIKRPKPSNVKAKAPIYQWQIGGRDQFRRICSYLYDDAGISLDRKRELAEKLIKERGHL